MQQHPQGPVDREKEKKGCQRSKNTKLHGGKNKEKH
jgi:hypothetical protein